MAYQPKSYRRFLASSVSAAVVASAAATVPADVQQADAAESFSDVSNDYWASQAIQNLTDEGIINGYPDETFAPGEDINRGQVAELLVKAFDLNVNEDAASSYDDLINESYHTPYAEAVTDAGFLQGREDGTMFAAGMDLTREQMATILVRAFDLVEMSGSDAEVADIDEANASHQENIQILADYGITSTEDNMFRPKETVTRAQFATFLDRALNDEEIGGGDGSTGDNSDDDNDDSSDDNDSDGNSGGSDDDSDDNSDESDNDGGSSGGGSGGSDDDDDDNNDSGGSGGSDNDSSALEEINNGNADEGTYDEAGIDGVTEENVDEVNDAVSDAQPENGEDLTQEEIQDIVDDLVQSSLEAIRNGNGDVTDYETIGTDGVTEDNVDEVNDAVTSDDSEDPLTPQDIQDIVDDLVQSSLEAIQNGDGDVSDYETVGAEGVTEDNLADVKEAVSNVEPAGDALTVEEIQEAVNDFLQEDALETINNGNADEGTYDDANVDGVTEENVDEVNDAVSDAQPENGEDLTQEEIQDIVDDLVQSSLEAIQNGDGDVSDYETVGAEGVTEDNLADVKEAVSSVEPAGDALTVEEIQEAVNDFLQEDALETINNGNADEGTYDDANVDGVTEENVDEVNDAVSDAQPENGEDLTQEEVQDIVDTVVEENTDDTIGEVSAELSDNNEAVSVSGSTTNMADGETVDIVFTNASGDQAGSAVTADVYDNAYSAEDIDISGFEPGDYTATVTSNVYGEAQNSTSFNTGDDGNTPAPEAPSGVETTAVSAEGAADGTITGVNDTQEYKAADAGTWTAVPESQTEISDLPAGDYEVRVAASGDTPAGEITTVTIDGASDDGQQSSISDVTASFDNDEVTVTGSTYNIPAEEQVDISFTGSNGNSVGSLATTATVTADDSFSTTTSVYSDVTAGDYTTTVTYGDISAEASAFNIPSNLVAAPAIEKQINEQFITDLINGGGTVGIDLANGENTLGSDVELKIEMETSGGVLGVMDLVGDSVLEGLGLNPGFLNPDPIIVNDSAEGDINYKEGTASYTFNDGPLTSILTGVVGILDTVPLISASDIIGTNIELTPVLTNGEQTQRGESKEINFDQDLIDLIRNNM
ncbi:S-layer homology domain-containing protein [Salibacterium sp. K-3]